MIGIDSELVQSADNEASGDQNRKRQRQRSSDHLSEVKRRKDDEDSVECSNDDPQNQCDQEEESIGGRN